MLNKNEPAIKRQFCHIGDLNHGEEIDTLEEEKYTVCRGLIHKYPHEVLVVLTRQCAAYCLFCTRKKTLSHETGELGDKDFAAMVKYLKNHPEVYEVIISGGDPLTQPALLKKALRIFGKLSQIKIIRVGTRLHFSNPKKINSAVIDALKVVKKQPLYLMLHFNHPAELNKMTLSAVKRLRQVSAMMLSQTVLLKGVNDSAEILSELFAKLTQIGIKPYYLLQCDKVRGAEHFMVDTEKAAKIYTDLYKKINGLAKPTLVIDTPFGVGKIPIPPNFWNCDRGKYVDYNGKYILI
ncbi:MAG: radical SAM protein [Candidatus Magasanikbacteria bacterium]